MITPNNRRLLLACMLQKKIGCWFYIPQLFQTKQIVICQSRNKWQQSGLGKKDFAVCKLFWLINENKMQFIFTFQLLRNNLK